MANHHTSTDCQRRVREADQCDVLCVRHVPHWLRWRLLKRTRPCETGIVALFLSALTQLLFFTTALSKLASALPTFSGAGHLSTSAPSSTSCSSILLYDRCVVHGMRQMVACSHQLASSPSLSPIAHDACFPPSPRSVSQSKTSITTPLKPSVSLSRPINHGCRQGAC